MILLFFQPHPFWNFRSPRLDFTFDKIRPRSDLSTVDSWHFDDKTPEPEHTPKITKKKKVAIAQELSDLVIYTHAVKFRGTTTSLLHVSEGSFLTLP